MSISWKNLPVTVMGLGKSGLASANFLASLGARVLVSESKAASELPGFLKNLDSRVQAEWSGHTERVLDSRLIVKSPGVPHLPILQQAAKRKIPIWSELELAFRFISPRALVAITGTNGKTTTTMMTSRIFQEAGFPVITGGNIGTPLCALIPQVTPKSVVVLEASSYQLEDTHTFRPDVAVLLNITPDHLEHHHTLPQYAHAKAKIFQNQKKSDVFIYNADDAWCKRLAARAPSRKTAISTVRSLRQGIFFQGEEIVIAQPGRRSGFDCPLQIPGRHNRENALAAAAAALALKVDISVIQKSLKNFPGVEHRIEYVETIRGIRFLNDSKATNVDSTKIALEALDSRSILLILGGRDKGAPYKPLIPLVKKKVKVLLTIGEAASLIEKNFHSLVPVHSCQTLEKAVQQAVALGQEGDIVLLSPACASFDQFQNFEHRGRVFKSLVKSL